MFITLSKHISMFHLQNTKWEFLNQSCRCILYLFESLIQKSKLSYSFEVDRSKLFWIRVVGMFRSAHNNFQHSFTWLDASCLIRYLNTWLFSFWLYSINNLIIYRWVFSRSAPLNNWIWIIMLIFKNIITTSLVFKYHFLNLINIFKNYI